VLTPVRYSRKPFDVEAVELSPDNIDEVAQWCGGEVRTSDLSKQGGLEGYQQYIKVPVKRPLNDRQTRAYYGDWVVAAGGSFKVYTPKAFISSFQKQSERMLETIDRMDANAEQDEKLDFDDVSGVRRSSFVSPTQ
jgi:hypothetical protein